MYSLHTDLCQTQIPLRNVLLVILAWSVVSGQRSEIRGQQSEVRGQRSEGIQANTTFYQQPTTNNKQTENKRQTYNKYTTRV